MPEFPVRRHTALVIVDMQDCFAAGSRIAASPAATITAPAEAQVTGP